MTTPSDYPEEPLAPLAGEIGDLHLEAADNREPVAADLAQPGEAQMIVELCAERGVFTIQALKDRLR